MKYPEHYQLKQWYAADRVLREDFNRDNEKIDAAITALRSACPRNKLAEITTDTEATQIDTDLSAYDLTSSGYRFYLYRLWGTLKAEMYYLRTFPDYSTQKRAIAEYIQFYNDSRYQLQPSRLAPMEYRIQ